MALRRWEFLVPRVTDMDLSATITLADTFISSSTFGAASAGLTCNARIGPKVAAPR